MRKLERHWKCYYKLRYLLDDLQILCFLVKCFDASFYADLK